MKLIHTALLLFVGLLLTGATSGTGCVPPPSAPSPNSRVIDEFKSVDEGEQYIWRIRPGRYRVRVTSSNDGVKIKWVGASCQKSGEIKVYDVVCEPASEAQLVVENPTTFGTGPTEQVTVTVDTM